METKSKQWGGKLPPEAVAFTRKLIIDAGVPIGLLSNIIYEALTARLKFALLLASISRLHKENMGPPYYYFTPVAVRWCLEAEKTGYHSLFIQGQHNESRKILGDAIYTDQFQPALNSTAVTVVRVDKADRGLKLLLEMFQFKFKEGDAEKYLLENLNGLGIAHARVVADTFFINPLTFVNDFTPVYGPGSAGRSLFILLGYQAFADKNDKTGTPALGWFEFRVISTQASERKNNGVFVGFHPDLNYPIPENSLMVVANVPWFKEEPPASN